MAGDSLTMPRGGRRFQPCARPAGRVRAAVSYDDIRESLGEDYAVMVQWFDEHGYAADIEGLRELHPGLMDFEGWLEQAEWVQEARRMDAVQTSGVGRG